MSSVPLRYMFVMLNIADVDEGDQMLSSVNNLIPRSVALLGTEP